MKSRYCVAIILTIAGLIPLWSQSTAASTSQTANATPAGILLYVDGDDFSVYRDSVLRAYTSNMTSVVGMSFAKGDFVQTGPDTTLEIQLLPGQSIVKIAENTSFRVISNPVGGASGLEIVYGKIRARIDATMGSGGFSIQGKTAIAGVRGTDFGYDVVAVPGLGAEPSSRVYTYEGTVVVQALKQGQTELDEDAPSYEVGAGNTITVHDTPDDASKSRAKADAGKDTVLASGERTVVFSKSIPASVDDYWKKNDFKSKSLEKDDIETIVENYRDKKAGNASTMEAGTAQMNAKAPESQARMTVADLVAPLEAVNALGSMKLKQYVIAPNDLKVLGVTLSSIGFLGSVAGLGLYGYGTDIFGISESDGQISGMATFCGSASVLLGGIVIYIIGLAQ